MSVTAAKSNLLDAWATANEEDRRQLAEKLYKSLQDDLPPFYRTVVNQYKGKAIEAITTAVI